MVRREKVRMERDVGGRVECEKWEGGRGECSYMFGEGRWVARGMEVR